MTFCFLKLVYWTLFQGTETLRTPLDLFSSATTFDHCCTAFFTKDFVHPVLANLKPRIYRKQYFFLLKMHEHADFFARSMTTFPFILNRFEFSSFHDYLKLFFNFLNWFRGKLNWWRVVFLSRILTIFSTDYNWTPKKSKIIERYFKEYIYTSTRSTSKGELPSECFLLSGEIYLLHHSILLVLMIALLFLMLHVSYSRGYSCRTLTRLNEASALSPAYSYKYNAKT